LKFKKNFLRKYNLKFVANKIFGLQEKMFAKLKMFVNIFDKILPQTYLRKKHKNEREMVIKKLYFFIGYRYSCKTDGTPEFVINHEMKTYRRSIKVKLMLYFRIFCFLYSS